MPTKDPTTPTPDPATFDIEAWLSGATRPETIVMLSSKGKEFGEFKTLELDLLKAQRAANEVYDERLVTVANTDLVRIAGEMDALSKTIEAGRQPFRLRGITESDLKVMRATTKDLAEDETTTHMLALCCVSPVLTAEDWARLRVVLGEGQYTQAVRAANLVSFGEAVDAPFSVAASVALATAAS